MPTGHYKRTPKTIYPYSLRAAYWSMMGRCYCKKNIGYHMYGGRGVTVCKEWKGKINVFCKWATENGWAIGLQLDKDKKGNGLLYSSETCCFITPVENSNNRRDNKKFLFNGDMLTLTQISRLCGVKAATLRRRIKVHGILNTNKAWEK